MSEKENEGERLLFEIMTYLRATAAIGLKEKAKVILNSYKKAIAYQNLDGNRSQTEIAKTCGVSQPMVSGYVNEFVSSGLAIEPNKYYRFHKALFSLGELGIDLTSLKKLEKPQKIEPSQEATLTSSSEETKEAGHA